MLKTIFPTIFFQCKRVTGTKHDARSIIANYHIITNWWWWNTFIWNCSKFSLAEKMQVWANQPNYNFFWTFRTLPFQPIAIICFQNFIKKIFWRRRSHYFNHFQLSVSEFDQSIISISLNVSSQPIRSSCLRTASKCYIFYESLHPNIIGRLRITSKQFLNFPHVSSQPSKSECLRIFQSDFQLFRTFPRSQSKESVSKFHQGIFKCSVRFLATNEERVS